ncbi:hypothetical protein [Paenibacillus chitinolyticus]|uniref:hypothetical protein n=1 Tax=Paenibacillus chitinolyticus TaxID=79263 RepID=UPI00365614D2
MLNKLFLQNVTRNDFYYSKHKKTLNQMKSDYFHPFPKIRTDSFDTRAKLALTDFKGWRLSRKTADLKRTETIDHVRPFRRLHS